MCSSNFSILPAMLLQKKLDHFSTKNYVGLILASKANDPTHKHYANLKKNYHQTFFLVTNAVAE
jgi:hypothetical protein